MKKILLALTLLAQLPAQAQPRFFIQPTIGAGPSNISFKSDPPLTPLVYTPLLGYTASVLAGMQFNRIRISTGVEYLHIAAKYKNVYGPDLTDEFNHILIPLNVGYQVPFGSKFSIVPTVGGAFSFNSNNMPTASLKKTSIWAQLRADVEYKLNNHISITAGPRFHYMLTNFVEPTPLSIGDANVHNYGILLSGGVLLQL